MYVESCPIITDQKISAIVAIESWSNIESFKNRLKYIYDYFYYFII